VGSEGPAGPAGAAGSVGPAGAMGSTGATGAGGPAGATGANGAVGPAGPLGATGPMGLAGPQGPQGAAGPTGATGSQGPSGATGAAGAQGPSGPAGLPGAAGATGLTGPQGAPGPVNFYFAVPSPSINLGSGPSTLATLSLPPGQYVFSATVYIQNASTQNGLTACSFGGPIQTYPTDGVNGSSQTIALLGTANFTSAQSVTLVCSSPSGATASAAPMTATQVTSATQQTAAQGFNFTESANYPGGAFPSSGYPNIGALGVGLNTISGTISGTPVPSGTNPGTFSVTLPAGMVITSGELTIANFTYNALNTAIDYASNVNGSVADPLNSSTTINGNGTYNLTANAPYSTAGTLDVSVVSPYFGSPQVNEFAAGGFSFTLQYTVAPAGN